MFRWYEKSAICYVYLADVETNEEWPVEDFTRKDGTFSNIASLVKNSRWFTPGWALQELLAPTDLLFFDRCWRVFGHCNKHFYRNFQSNSVISLGARRIDDMAELLHSITNINQTTITTPDQLKSTPAAEKLSWAAYRQTTRKEDMAYCLLVCITIPS